MNIQEIHFCQTRESCPMQLFHFWSHDVHPVQNLLLCTKFHENRMILLRYGDISIFKMAAVRHCGIVLLPYDTTNFMSIWYTELKIQMFEFFAYLAWNAYLGPQNGSLGDFGPLYVIINHRDPQKAHSCVNPRVLSYQHYCKNLLRGLTWRWVES